MMPTDNAYAMLARERKARQIADYLAPRLDDWKMPVSLLSDMDEAWWISVAAMAGTNRPSAETRALVVQYLHDRQRAEFEASHGKDNQGR